jgi:hypothetical protein
MIPRLFNRKLNDPEVRGIPVQPKVSNLEERLRMSVKRVLAGVLQTSTEYGDFFKKEFEYYARDCI